MNGRVKLGLALLGLAGFVVMSSAFVVPQTHQALILQFGSYVRTEKEPGLKFKVPFLQTVELYDARLLDFNAEPKPVISADQKRLIVDAFVRYRITDPLKYKQAVGGDERVMKSRLNAMLESSLRQTIGSVPLSSVISEERTRVMQRIRDLVNAQAQGARIEEALETGENGEMAPDVVATRQGQGFGIEVVDVRIMRADLPKENAEGIYRRMQTEREREAKEFRAKGAEDAQKIRATAEKERTILLAEARKKAEILRGEGDGEAIRIFAAATGQDPEFYQFYRTLAAYRKTLTSKDTTMIVSPQSDFLKTLERGAQ